LPESKDPNLLSKGIPFADAGIYRLTEECALVQSVDFFTPVVDDPYLFGQIAVANALSDIYAVGGKPLTALNLVSFPSCSLDNEVLAAILLGGAEKVAEAGAVIVGGHSIEDAEPKYGIAVTGLVDPRRMMSTVGCQPGDKLVLTKPLGTGLLTTALKRGLLSEVDIADALAGMATLNDKAAACMMEVGVSASTDITGFGLIGHALEMAEASDVCLVFEADALPAYPRAMEMARKGTVPGGSFRNRNFYLPRVDGADDLTPEVMNLFADPQTSGGLLIAVSPKKVNKLVNKLEASGTGAFVIGKVEDRPAGRIRIG
jgi:selenide, water dikinase